MFIPQSTSGSIESRYYSCGRYQYLGDDGNCYGSSFNSWGRWVLAAVVIVFFILLFVSWSCLSNRRRRRRGMQPRYGTGWVMGGQGYNNNNGYAYNGQQQQPQYNNNNGGWFGGFGNHKHNNNPPPPQYTPNEVPPQTTGHTFNSNEGYYGQQQNDVPLQQPAGSYYPRGGENVYEPPTGPPPAKH